MRKYETIEGWFNMEQQYRILLNLVPINGVFVEIGCWKGKSTAFLLEEVQKDNLPRKIYVIDNFKGSTNTEIEREVYANVNSSHLYNEFIDNINYVSKFLTSVYRSESDIAADLFSNNSVDVCFIDAGHSYENVRNDITAWLPKIKKGGMLAGHDYNESWPGVIQAVNKLLGQENITVENNCWFYKI